MKPRAAFCEWTGMAADRRSKCNQEGALPDSMVPIRTEFRGHRDRVTALAFTHDGRLVSGSVDTTVLAWDIRAPIGDTAMSLPATWDAQEKPGSAAGVQGDGPA